MSQFPNARSKPWLLPYNRRLRHLHGITIRNITRNRETRHQRTKTIDDEGVPSTFKSPTKALALRERKLKHSSSSQGLRDRNKNAATDDGEEPEEIQNLSPKRPTYTRRRRSTMDWSGMSPAARQRKLQDTAQVRMADVFFSIHTEEEADPIYVSELAERVINPDFRAFDFGTFGPTITRLNKLRVRIWARFEDAKSYIQLVDLLVELDALQYIGKSLASFKQPLPSNCVVFHLADGLYTSFFDAKIPNVPDFGKSSKVVAPGRTTVTTSSYDALMRLATLDDCIQDAVSTRNGLIADMQRILDEHTEQRIPSSQVPEAKERLRTVETVVSMQRKRLEATRKQQSALQRGLVARRQAIERGRKALAEEKAVMIEARGNFASLQDSSSRVAEDILGQRRRIAEELMRIFPIEPISGRSLSFTIRGLPLPNSEFDYGTNDLEVAAALGYCARVVYELALYLGIPLPYPIKAHESTSSVEDPISTTTGASRVYPLFIKGTVRYRFEYGVFLLNKDIEIISNWLGLRVLDIRQTLPNLKYAMYVASAGKGELPSRKAGGIRGLARQTVITQAEGAILGSTEGANGSAVATRGSQ